MRKKNNWWGISSGLIVFGIFCIVLPIEAWKGNLEAKLIFDFAIILISWPVSFLIIALLFIYKFQPSIDIYLRNISHMKLPGGVEINTQKSKPESKIETEHSDHLVLTPEQQETINEIILDLEDQQQLTQEKKELLEKQLDQMSYVAIEWKFSYLNEFFAVSTKRVLNWFSTASPQTRDYYYTFWQPIITDSEQLEIILAVLINYGFLIEEGGVLRITDHGYSFLQFIGLIPPTPTATIG